jgi:predicted transcriptional regulator
LDPRGRVIAVRAYVRDIMTTGVVTVRPDTPYRTLAAMFRGHRVSGFPVTADDGTVIGVVKAPSPFGLVAGSVRHAVLNHAHGPVVTVATA